MGEGRGAAYLTLRGVALYALLPPIERAQADPRTLLWRVGRRVANSLSLRGYGYIESADAAYFGTRHIRQLATQAETSPCHYPHLIPDSAFTSSQRRCSTLTNVKLHRVSETWRGSFQISLWDSGG